MHLELNLKTCDLFLVALPSCFVTLAKSCSLSVLPLFTNYLLYSDCPLWCLCENCHLTLGALFLLEEYSELLLRDFQTSPLSRIICIIAFGSWEHNWCQEGDESCIFCSAFKQQQSVNKEVKVAKLSKNNGFSKDKKVETWHLFFFFFPWLSQLTHVPWEVFLPHPCHFWFCHSFQYQWHHTLCLMCTVWQMFGDLSRCLTHSAVLGFY